MAATGAAVREEPSSRPLSLPSAMMSCSQRIVSTVLASASTTKKPAFFSLLLLEVSVLLPNNGRARLFTARFSVALHMRSTRSLDTATCLPLAWLCWAYFCCRFRARPLALLMLLVSFLSFKPAIFSPRMIDMICNTVCSKPISSSRSTSSSTTQRSFVRWKDSVELKWSNSRPGVPTSTTMPLRRRPFSLFFRSPPVIQPPTIHTQHFVSLSSTSAICVHSSRVGAMIRVRHPSERSARGLKVIRSLMMGTK
mmetsp:Transcript_65649/g.115792  ORF Transcript_65649/g.115792 Transcript_65649/m.115792 type:complete len:253 (-) Transcript_65649:423-1181(-)